MVWAALPQLRRLRQPSLPAVWALNRKVLRRPNQPVALACLAKTQVPVTALAFLTMASSLQPLRVCLSRHPLAGTKRACPQALF
jgi:hypothetical protein